MPHSKHSSIHVRQAKHPSQKETISNRLIFRSISSIETTYKFVSYVSSFHYQNNKFRYTKLVSSVDYNIYLKQNKSITDSISKYPSTSYQQTYKPKMARTPRCKFWQYFLQIKRPDSERSKRYTVLYQFSCTRTM